MEQHLAWLHHRGLRPSTIAARRYHLTRFRKFLGGGSLLEVSSETLRAYQQGLTSGPYARANVVHHLRAFYRWASEVGLCPPDLLRSLVAPKLPQRLPRPISPTDLAVALINAPARLKPWLLLGAFAGLRACEVAPLRAEHLDLSARTVFIIDGKGGKQRVVPLADALVTELRACHLPTRGWLFPKLTRTGEPTSDHVSASQVSHLASAYLHEIGSDSSFHALRHRAGTDWWADSLDLRLVQDLLGHASPRETAGYAALVPGKAAEVVGRTTAARLQTGYRPDDQVRHTDGEEAGQAERDYQGRQAEQEHVET